VTDYTKEDLVLFLKWMNEVTYAKEPTKELIEANEILGERINEMIENYCRHDWTSVLPGLPTFCCKCNRYLHD